MSMGDKECIYEYRSVIVSINMSIQVIVSVV